VESGRQFGAADEFAAGPPDVNQGEIARGKRAAMALVAFERPHLRAQEGSGPFSISV
jgi:hypothetical protein